jgi:hypothetical protein
MTTRVNLPIFSLLPNQLLPHQPAKEMYSAKVGEVARVHSLQRLKSKKSLISERGDTRLKAMLS